MNIKQKIAIPLLATALLASSLGASAATSDYYLKFDGINGSSTAKGHERWIEFNSFSWGVSQNVGQTGGSSSRPAFTDFFWSQGLDAVTGLFSTIGGRGINSATADFSTQIGEREVTYFRMKFDDVDLTSLNLSGISGVSPHLDGSFSYAKVTLDYWTFESDGSVDSHTSAFYDLKKSQGGVANVASVFAMGLGGVQIAATVPEPENYAMFLAGLAALGLIAKRRMGLN